MKSFVILCLLCLVVLSLGKPSGRGCRYIIDECYQECEEGTHGYTVGCGHRIPEATCDEPNPVKEKQISCDYSAYHCDRPTVRDNKSGKCVPLEKCPKK